MAFDADSIRTLVVKIGTNLLSGRRAFDGKVMEGVVKEICHLKQDQRMRVLLVSSGAVGCGMNTLGLENRPEALPQKQAVAAVGQATLVHYYETLFRTYGGTLHCAQVLLTSQDLDNRQVYLNVRNTLNTLFDLDCVVPIINENDSTATEELGFSDNDNLAAKIAAKIGADLLIVLSDVDGLYDRDPDDKDATLVHHVDRITPAIIEAAGGAGSVAATGGMRAKVEAAKIACAAGVPVAIANGHTMGVVHGVLDGTIPHTRFAPSESTLSHRKRWIAFGRTTQGAVVLDEGARKALVKQGKSLLAAGIVGVEGAFGAGAAVILRDPGGHNIAHALVNYGSEDIRRIQGRKSTEIAGILGHKDFDEVAHRDNIVLID